MAERSRTALVVDDEPDLRELVVRTLARMDVDCHGAANLDEARHLLAHYHFDLCLTDLRLPDGNGVDFVGETQRDFPAMPIAVVTAHGQLDVAVASMRQGAFDFVSKPLDIARLRTLVNQALALSSPTLMDDTSGSLPATGARSAHEPAAAAALARADDAANHTGTARCDWPGSDLTVRPRLLGGERLLGSSDTMQALRRLIAKVARTNVPVWLTGESGTGKEVIARLIHQNSSRAAAPFVPINCGAIPAELMESEFFGHRKGSFSGAHADRIGLFQSADGGTLFLDEVAELPLHMQVKLLRAIQERSIRAVGDSEESPVDVRILSATHRDLADAVEAGQFRHDLYYRLNVIAIRAPALRDRPEDIAELSDAILRRIAGDTGEALPHRLTADARGALEAHEFPGNVRELENLLERAVALSESSTIHVSDLGVSDAHPVGRGTADSPISIVRNTPAASQPLREERRHDPETRRLLDALDAHRWNRRAAARTLGLTYRQLRYRLEQLDLRRPG